MNKRFFCVFVCILSLLLVACDKNKDYELCKSLSKQAEKIQPDFLCEELYDNFKRRLYTKDPSLYKRWEHLGKSDANYYYVDGNWLKYENGKKEIVNNI